MLLRFFCILILSSVSATVARADEITNGVSLPAGFKIQKIAGDDLASNIYCMTINGKGQTVVSGPGYIKTLTDENKDGVYDKFLMYSDRPRQGAQGMCFYEDSLIAIGDGGLHKFVDTDQDGKADGPPQKIFDVTTGGEHHAHAIRLGPNRTWYLLCGNQTKIREEYYDSPNSPVKKPHAGFLMRMDYEFKNKEIVAHGFRNAYDFDINLDGEFFVYDSDGERDVSMPWYRPTRLFKIRPGDHAGWINESWKRPDYFFDMPEVIGRLGRGSPTGVRCYLHDQFPSEYDNAIFTADWTFGRIVVFKQDPQSLKYDNGSEFAIANGEFGFAVTDLEVAPDGSLLVCVGGRGTEGGVYRISWTGKRSIRLANEERQPNSSWSRMHWKKKGLEARKRKARKFPGFPTRFGFLPIIHELDSLQVIRAKVNELQLLANHRQPYAKQFASSAVAYPKSKRLGAASIRLMSTWQPWDRDAILLISKLLVAADPEYRLAALEALVGRTDYFSTLDEAATRVLTTGLRSNLEKFDSSHARLIFRILKGLPETVVAKIDTKGLPALPQLLFQVATSKKNDATPVFDAIEKGLFVNEQVDRLVLLRLLQLSIGDCPPKPNRGVFSGHISAEFELPEGKTKTDLAKTFRRLQLDKGYTPTREQALELARLVGMLSLSNTTLTSPFVDSNSLDDIHWLACFAQTTDNEAKQKRSSVVRRILMNVVAKRKAEKRDHDRNWYPHLTRLARSIFSADEELALSIIADPDYPGADDAFLHDAFPKVAKQLSSLAFARQVKLDPKTATARQLQIALEADKNLERQFLKSCLNHPQLRDTAILELAKNPGVDDRDALRIGLSSLNPTVIKNSIVALRRLSGKAEPAELISAFAIARSRGWDKQDVSIRDQVMMLLQQQTDQKFGYQPKKNGLNQNGSLKQWAAYLQQEFPAEFKSQFDRPGGADFETIFAKIDWEQGDSKRGEVLYRELQCAQCHDGGNRLGPQLNGITSRFSKRDLFRSIVFPNEQVPARYRAVVLETVDGLVYRGSTIYESVDGITLMEASGKTVRVNKSNIEDKTQSLTSTMPEGLLKSSQPADWADLYMYLKSVSSENRR